MKKLIQREIEVYLCDVCEIELDKLAIMIIKSLNYHFCREHFKIKAIIEPMCLEQNKEFRDLIPVILEKAVTLWKKKENSSTKQLESI